MKLFSSKKKSTKSGVKIAPDKLYNYSDTESREATIRFLRSFAEEARQPHEEYWKRMKQYYDEEHDTSKQMAAFIDAQGLPWKPTQCTDGFIHVETQIDPKIPDFEFSGRDDILDPEKAKQREDVVRYIIDNNPMETMNTRNERRMNTYGIANWKVFFDAKKRMHGAMIGDIGISNPKMTQLFYDMSASENIDDCEYVGFVYRMHKMKVRREYAEELKKLGKTIDDFSLGYGKELTEFMRDENEQIDSSTYDYPDETLMITEWWFRQPEGGSFKKEFNVQNPMTGIEERVTLPVKWEAGDIACVILINETEVKYIPKYWVKTNCDMYPFSSYCKVPNDDFIYGKSEIEMIQPHIDAADRSLSYAQLNDAFMANDMVVYEENSLADSMNGSVPNHPGASVITKSGQISNVRRMGNLSSANKPLYESAENFRDMMQQTNGNFDAFQGNEPQRVTTATGIAILNDRSRSRQDIKKPDRNAGFKRLFLLCDYTALEFFDDNRVIFIGADKANNPQQVIGPDGMPSIVNQPIVFKFNSDNYKVLDDETQQYYYPTLDCTINVGDGLKNSKAFTIEALKELANMTITPQNYEIVLAYLEQIDIPQRKRIKDFIESIMKNPQPNSDIPMNEVLKNLNPDEVDALDKMSDEDLAKTFA